MTIRGKDCNNEKMCKDFVTVLETLSAVGHKKELAIEMPSPAMTTHAYDPVMLLLLTQLEMI